MSKTIGTATALSFVILLSTARRRREHSPPATPGAPPQATPPAPRHRLSDTAAAPNPRPPPSRRTTGSSQGDKLRVEVYKDTQLSQSLQVRPDGKITLPLLGDIAAAGKTPTELRDTLTAALREYITNPVVTVIVVETHTGDCLRDGRSQQARPAVR